MNNAQKLQWISENIPEENHSIDSSLESLYVETLAHKLREEIGLYFFVRNGAITCESIAFHKHVHLYGSETVSYDDLVKDFWGHIGKVNDDLGLDFDSLKLRYHFDYSAQYVRVKSVSDKKVELTIPGDRDIADFLRCLRWVVLDTVDPDRKIVLDSVKANEDVDDSVFGDRSFEATSFNCLPGITLKRFKNGRLDIKGLDKKSVARLQKVLEVVNYLHIANLNRKDVYFYWQSEYTPQYQ